MLYKWYEYAKENIRRTKDMEESFDEEVSIIDILKLAWKKKWIFIILLIFSLILLIVYMLYMVKPEYTTTTKIAILKALSMSSASPGKGSIGPASNY